jgi:hypothetical protein
LKIPVTNNGKTMMYVGSSIIPPGETRHFDENEVPPSLRPTPPDLPTTPGLPLSGEEALAEQLLGTVADIAAALSDMALADIERLGELEQTGQARKGVLAAIAETLLKRADKSDLQAHAASLSDAELAAALEDMGTDINADPDLLAAFEAEAARRKEG